MTIMGRKTRKMSGLEPLHAAFRDVEWPDVKRNTSEDQSVAYR